LSSDLSRDRPLSAAIVNYNGRRYLENTVSALLACAPGVREVLIVDSGSTDGSAEMVEKKFSEARLVRLQDNRGPGPARNTAIAEATHDRILLLDNDVALQPGCSEYLTQALDDYPKAVAAFAAMRYANATETVQFVAGEPHFLGTMRLLGADVPASEISLDPFLVASAPTSCLLLDRSRLLDGSRFDERITIYLEDHEWCLRTVLKGMDLVAHPAAQCLHGEGTVGISIRETGGFSALRVRHTILNRWQVLLKLYQLRTLLRFAPTLLLFEGVQLAGVARKGWLSHWCWAVSALIRGLPDLARRRRAFQRCRTRQDLDVLRAGPFPYNSAMVSGRMEELARKTLDGVAALNWRLAGGPE